MGGKDRDANSGRSAIRHSINGGCWYLAGCQHLYGHGKCPLTKCKGKGYDDRLTEANKANYKTQISERELWDDEAFDLQYVRPRGEQELSSNGREGLSVFMPRS